MENVKINFYTRVKKAIFNFDEYEKFITEPISKSIGYFIKLLVLFSIIITIVLTYRINKEAKNILEVINEIFPNFKIENSQLEIEAVDNYEYYFEEINLKIIMDEKDLNVENTNYSNCLVLFKNKVVLKFNGLSQELLYRDIFNENISKEKISIIRNTKEWITILFSVGIFILLICFIIYFIIIALDIVTLSIMGLIINFMIRTKFKYKEILKISIYAITLPLILYLCYIVLNISFGVTIKYFEIAYNAISYIYLITVLLIMKSEIIRNTIELQKILEEQKKVKEELEREKQEEKEKQDEANRKPKDKKKETPKDNPEGELQTDN